LLLLLQAAAHRPATTAIPTIRTAELHVVFIATSCEVSWHRSTLKLRGCSAPTPRNQAVPHGPTQVHGNITLPHNPLAFQEEIPLHALRSISRIIRSEHQVSVWLAVFCPLAIKPTVARLAVCRAGNT
jgi:hypothetical protein